IKPGVLRQNRPAKRRLAIELKPVAKVAAGLIAVVIVGLVIIGSVGGSSNSGGGQKPKGASHHGGTGPASTSSTTTGTAPSGQVSLEVRSTAPVWVCLVDDAGHALVNGETLSADQARGPFAGPG